MANPHDWYRYYNGPEDSKDIDINAGYGFYDLEDEEIEMMERQRISEIKSKPAPASAPAPAAAPVPTPAPKPQPQPQPKPKPIENSPEMQQAKERVQTYESDILSGKTSNEIYNKNDSQNFLDKYKMNLNS